jgi:phosphoglycolate phosphatase
MLRMRNETAGLIVWDVDGTLIPADLRWLRRSIARTYQLQEGDIVFPSARVHGYTDESIVVDTAICSGVEPDRAEAGVSRFHDMLAQVMSEGREELAREQPAYPGAADTIQALHQAGFVQTVLTGNLKHAAEVKLSTVGLEASLDLSIGGFGSDARDRFTLPEVIAERFLARYGQPLNPGRTVVIGDAPNDIACARHAGFNCIVIAQRLGHDELLQHKPDAVLDGLVPELVVEAVRSLVAG